MTTTTNDDTQQGKWIHPEKRTYPCRISGYDLKRMGARPDDVQAFRNRYPGGVWYDPHHPTICSELTECLDERLLEWAHRNGIPAMDVVSARYTEAQVSYRGRVHGGVGAEVTAGTLGVAIVEDHGVARAGLRGTAWSGPFGKAHAAKYGRARAGDYGVATAGSCGSAEAGRMGRATAGADGCASVGAHGIAIVGPYGWARGEEGAVLCFRQGPLDGAQEVRVRVGDDGVEPGVWYQSNYPDEGLSGLHKPHLHDPLGWSRVYRELL